MGPKKGKKAKKAAAKENGEDSPVPQTPVDGEFDPNALPETPIDNEKEKLNGITDDDINAAAITDPAAAVTDEKLEALEDGSKITPTAGEPDTFDPMQFQEKREEAPDLVAADPYAPKDLDAILPEVSQEVPPPPHHQHPQHPQHPHQHHQRDASIGSAGAVDPIDPIDPINPVLDTAQIPSTDAPLSNLADPQTPTTFSTPHRPKLESLMSPDPSFSASRYLSLNAPAFTSRPHHDVDISHDLDSRNMASSFSSWYNKLFSLADSLEFSKGWPVVEEFDVFADMLDQPFKQISIWPPEEFFARKPRDATPDEQKGADDQKYELFWAWKSKIALSGFCANFSSREIFGKSIFALTEPMVKRFGSAMFVFAKDFDDEVTATKFRQMTIRLLFESTPYKKTAQKEMINLSNELTNALAPLAALLPRTKIDHDAQPGAKETTKSLDSIALTTIVSPTATLHNSIHKDPVYFALYHPLPGQAFDENLMEEVTFESMGQGRGDVGFICRPGLMRMGFPKYGEAHDIGIVMKARVLREGAMDFE